jgi:hypothetical protein
MLSFIGLFRASAQSHPDPFSAAFITNIAESSFRHAHLSQYGHQALDRVGAAERAPQLVRQAQTGAMLDFG